MNKKDQKKINKIDDYLLGKLSAKETEEFEIFLFANPELLEEVKMREQMIKLIKKERVTLVSESQDARLSPSIMETLKNFFLQPRPGWVYAGAMAAILLVIVFIPSLINNNISPAFMGNESMEPYLGETHRSVGNLNVSVQSPEIGEKFSRNIVFKWETQKEDQTFAGALDLKIMNNKEDIMQNLQVKANDVLTIALAQPGLYYWILEYEGEMLYLGKFIVSGSQD